MGSDNNHRAVPRHHANVVCMDVCHDPMPMVDISTKGVSFIGTGFAPGDVVNLWLVSAANEKDSVETLCSIVSVVDDRVAALFIQRTERLESFIIAHISDPPLISGQA